MTKQVIMFAAALLVLGTGGARAAIPNTTDYLHRTMPMISGVVSSVDDRQIVVDTDQDQRVTLVMDSRTLLPIDLAPGMMMRAEFRVMENGQYYVTRIMPIRDGANARRAQASRRERDQALDLARANTARRYAGRGTNGPFMTATQPAVIEPSPVAAGGEAEELMAADASRTSDRPETLPQTAGAQPMIGLLGLLALGGASVLMLRRQLCRA